MQGAEGVELTTTGKMCSPILVLVLVPEDWSISIDRISFSFSQVSLTFSQKSAFATVKDGRRVSTQRVEPQGGADKRPPHHQDPYKHGRTLPGFEFRLHIGPALGSTAYSCDCILRRNSCYSPGYTLLLVLYTNCTAVIRARTNRHILCKYECFKARGRSDHPELPRGARRRVCGCLVLKLTPGQCPCYPNPLQSSSLGMNLTYSDLVLCQNAV